MHPDAALPPQSSKEEQRCRCLRRCLRLVRHHGSNHPTRRWQPPPVLARRWVVRIGPSEQSHSKLCRAYDIHAASRHPARCALFRDVGVASLRAGRVAMVLLARSARLHVFVRRPREGVARGMSCHAAIIRALPSQTADCAVTVCRGRRGWLASAHHEKSRSPHQERLPCRQSLAARKAFRAHEVRSKARDRARRGCERCAVLFRCVCLTHSYTHVQ